VQSGGCYLALGQHPPRGVGSAAPIGKDGGKDRWWLVWVGSTHAGKRVQDGTAQPPQENWERGPRGGGTGGKQGRRACRLIKAGAR